MPQTTITCVRHAQGFHNLNTASHSIPDPLLTPLGHTQCATLASTFPSPQKITHLVASPLRRTIYTALLSFPTVVARGVKVIALPELQETSDLPCDTGSEVELLEKEFGTTQVDLSRVTKGWNSKQGRWSPAASAVESRAREARVFLHGLAREYAASNPGEDAHIAVVTHGGFLHFFTEDWSEHEKFEGTGWANTEVRSYAFIDEKRDALVELDSSRESRGVRPLSESEQRNLKESAEKEWAESGYTTPREMEVERVEIPVS